MKLYLLFREDAYDSDLLGIYLNPEKVALEREKLQKQEEAKSDILDEILRGKVTYRIWETKAID